MKKLFPILALLMALLSACEKDAPKPEPTEEWPELFVAGYVPGYSFAKFDFEMMQHIDRIYYFSLFPDAEGNFQISETQRQHIEQLIQQKQTNAPELFVVIGGWYESENIFAMAADPQKMKNYVDKIVELCQEYKLDGVDLDWEAYPTAVPQNDYFALVSLLSEELHKNKLKLSVAVAASHHNFAAKIKNLADQINIMSYGILDENGNQVTMDQVQGWLSKFDAAGVPRQKLIVGVPFYGKRPYKAGDDSPRAITYRSIVVKASPDYGTNKYQNYAFNGRGLMQTKTKYLRQNSYYGIMAWELTQDVAYNSQFSLLQSINDMAK